MILPVEIKTMMPYFWRWLGVSEKTDCLPSDKDITTKIPEIENSMIVRSVDRTHD
jgi:hypothetical protein